MSTTKQIVVHCDQEGCDSHLVIDDPRQWEARVKAREFGWIQHDKLDECPKHTLL